MDVIPDVARAVRADTPTRDAILDARADHAGLPGPEDEVTMDASPDPIRTIRAPEMR